MNVINDLRNRPAAAGSCDLAVVMALVNSGVCQQRRPTRYSRYSIALARQEQEHSRSQPAGNTYAQL